MRIVSLLSLASCSLLLAGCSGTPVMTTTSTQPDQVQGTALHGRVRGGQNPISGASVYLYAVGTGGYGGNGIVASSSNASTSLLNSNVLSQTPAGGIDSSNNYYVTTDGSGNFSITSDYTCPSASAQVYLYAVGGNPGAGSNSAAGLLAGLGSCGSLNSSTYIVVNEVSTIATAYSIAGYATDATHISSSGTALAATDVANAFATIANLETLSTGVALATTPTSGGSVPQAKISTLANILAACINSTGPSSTGCTTLLSGALSGGTTGTAPTDTATAAINIAHHPVANMANLFALQTANSPFMPDLSAVPNDFTISIVVSGGEGSEFGYPEYVAVDASGNIWVTNGQAYCCVHGEVSKFSNTGVNINNTGYFGFGMSYPMGIAIDATGNVWTANLGDHAVGDSFSGTISKLSSTGAILNPYGLSGSGYTAGGFSNGFGIAIDATGNVWAGNAGGGSVNSPYDNGHGTALVELDSSGNVLSGASGFTGGGINGPLGVAIDNSGNVWTANSGNWTISEFGSTGTPISPSGGYTGGGLNDPYGIAVGPGPFIWAANENNSTWTAFTDTGTSLFGGSASGDNVTNPFSLALDGAGNIWIPSGNGTLEEFASSGALSGTTGFSDGYTNAYVGIAIDGSGNVWVVRPNGINSLSVGSLTEFVGAAVPVVTPIVANLRSPYGSQPVNEP
ncbi:MAG: hypothetical protein WBE72_01535 [Terracidiphilus sp.]